MKTRKLALCVGTWSSEETVHAWVWLKTHLLQAKDPRVVDELFIIHVASAKSRDKSGQRWDAGGPVVPDVKTAASGYGAKIIELEGAPGAAIVDFVQKEGMDVVVIGTRGRGNIKRKVLGSVTEYVIRRVKCACLVAGAKVGVGDSYRMKSAAQPLLAPALSAHLFGSQPSSPTEAAVAPAAAPGPAARTTTRQLSLSSVRLGVSPPHLLVNRQPKKPDPTAVGDASIRRVAVVFDNLDNGRAVLSWLQQAVLIPADQLFIVQWKSFPLASQLRQQQFTPPSSDMSALVEETVPGHSQVVAHQLQSDKSGITNYMQKEAIDLLVIGRARARTARNALIGKRVSTYIYLASPCPCLLVQLGPDGADDDTDSDVDSADEGQHVFSSDDDYGVTSPQRARSGSPGRLDTLGASTAVSGVPTLVQTVQQHLKRASSENAHFAGVKEMLVQLDDRGQITRLTPVTKHGRSPSLGQASTQDPGVASPGTPGTPKVLTPVASAAPNDVSLVLETASVKPVALQPAVPASDAGPATPLSVPVATTPVADTTPPTTAERSPPQEVVCVGTPDVEEGVMVATAADADADAVKKTVPGVASSAATTPAAVAAVTGVAAATVGAVATADADSVAVEKTLQTIVDDAVSTPKAAAAATDGAGAAAAEQPEAQQQLMSTLQQQLKEKDDELALMRKQIQLLQERDNEIALLKRQLEELKVGKEAPAGGREGGGRGARQGGK